MILQYQRGVQAIFLFDESVQDHLDSLDDDDLFSRVQATLLAAEVGVTVDESTDDESTADEATADEATVDEATGDRNATRGVIFGRPPMNPIEGLTMRFVWLQLPLAFVQERLDLLGIDTTIIADEPEQDEEGVQADEEAPGVAEEETPNGDD